MARPGLQFMGLGEPQFNGKNVFRASRLAEQHKRCHREFASVSVLECLLIAQLEWFVCLLACCCNVWCVIIMLICRARGLIFMLEQPASSLLRRHPRFQAALKSVP